MKDPAQLIGKWAVLFAGLAVSWFGVWTLWFSPHALFMAASKGAPADIKAVLARGCPVNAHDSWGSGPALLMAASAGKVENVKALLAAGADVNATNQFGNTALILAVRKKRDAVLEELLRAGADPLQRNKRGVCALQEAERLHDALAVRVLTAAVPKMAPIPPSRER